MLERRFRHATPQVTIYAACGKGATCTHLCGPGPATHSREGGNP